MREQADDLLESSLHLRHVADPVACRWFQEGSGDGSACVTALEPNHLTAF